MSAQTVAEVMSRPVLTVDADDSLWDAWQLLFVSGLRHLVVLDTDGTCLGVLSDRNILADHPATEDHLGARRVRDILARVPLICTGPEATPASVARTMCEQSVEGVPVLESGGRVVGIVTEADLVRWMAA